MGGYSPNLVNLFPAFFLPMSDGRSALSVILNYFLESDNVLAKTDPFVTEPKLPC
jgi:hypothetical protein